MRVRVSRKILNTSLETLKMWKIRCHSLSSKATGCVTNINTANYSNVLYTSNSISKFTMVLQFWFLKVISSQCNYSNEFLLVCGFRPKRCIKFPKFSSWGPFIYQIQYVISLINTKTKRIFQNPKIQVLSTETSWV